MVSHVFPVSLKKIACAGGLAGHANCSRHELADDPCVIACVFGAAGVRSGAGSDFRPDFRVPSRRAGGSFAHGPIRGRPEVLVCAGRVRSNIFPDTPFRGRPTR
ncbi:Uncharacterized protein pbN1_18310 [Aromatoleum bremense]|nr:Uncharacterized protein pbN1_18310 [Aromatoleum bremense]